MKAAVLTRFEIIRVTAATATTTSHTTTQVFLFNDIPNTYTVVGAILIFSSALGIGIRKYFKDNSPLKQQQQLLPSTALSDGDQLKKE